MRKKMIITDNMMVI